MGSVSKVRKMEHSENEEEQDKREKKNGGGAYTGIRVAGGPSSV